MSEVTSNTKSNSIHSSATVEEGFFNLTPDEMEQLAQIAVEKAVERMHTKGIATITSKDGKIYQQHPDGRLEPYSIDLNPTAK